MKLQTGLLAGMLLCGCSVQKHATAPAAQNALVPDGKLWASLFQQRAGEYKALCLQAYNIAQLRLEQAIRQRSTTGKPLAVVTDVDETFLDNSPYDVKQALAGKDYEGASWQQWTGLGQADTLPGALRFFKYAADNQVAVFYITNRGEAEREGTAKNLRRYGFPLPDNSRLILKQSGASSSKETRRQEVLKNYDIVLLLGDNLGDFSTLFDSKTEEERNANTLAAAADFGKRFIVLPNPVYGDWESSFFKHEPRFTPAQKDSVIKARLKTY